MNIISSFLALLIVASIGIIVTVVVVAAWRVVLFLILLFALLGVVDWAFKRVWADMRRFRK